LGRRYHAEPMDVEVAFTGVAVSDLAAGLDFFERLFGKPPDVLVNDNEVMWRVNEAAWLYAVVDPARAGRALAALSVADLDAALAELAARGLQPSKLEEHEGAPARPPSSTPTATPPRSSRSPLAHRGAPPAPEVTRPRSAIGRANKESGAASALDKTDQITVRCC